MTKNPQLVETVTGRTMAELTAARDAVSRADLVELRVDGVEDLDVAGALTMRALPAIVTCRASWEGGRFEGSEERRKAILLAALAAGAEFVDVEWRAGFTDVIARDPARVIVSSHDFGGVPEDLASRALAMRQTGAAVIKVAVTASRLADALPLRAIGEAGNAVVIAMGDAGVPSRILAARFGSRWTFAGQAVAPGQIPAARMLDEFRLRDITAATAIYGVVGNNVMHSLSPVMHNAAFADAGIDAVYVPLRAADFQDFLEFAGAMGVKGASVTIPFKLDALDAAASVDGLTRAVGAANTLRRAAEGWDATNTDVGGFLEPLEALYPGSLQGIRAAVLGAGGAARAVAIALTSRGARVTIHARRREQASHVAASCKVGASEWQLPPHAWDLLVNCTPLGGPTARDASPMPGGPFDGTLVYDLTYGDSEAPLLRDAREAGCLTLDGLPMLIAQAERQFEWWTGTRPRPGVMKQAALRRTARADRVGEAAVEL